MRIPWWSLVLGATLLGAGVGVAVAAAGSAQSKAEAKVVVQAAGGPADVRPLLPNVRELATSSLLAGNVDSTLRLPGSPEDLRKRLHASIAPDSQVIVLGISDSNGDRARQIAQESAVVLTQLVRARFRTPQLSATVLDPAHVVAKHDRRFLLNALIGAAVGLAVSAAVLAVLLGLPSGQARMPADGAFAARELQLKKRIDLVGKRERELARRAGELARREGELANRTDDIATYERAVENERREIPSTPAVESEPEPVGFAAEPEPSAPRTHAFLRPRAGWNVNELERAIATRTDVTSETIDEWRTYLFLLRGHADTEGTLPTTFDALVDDVFAELTGLNRGD